MAGIFCVRYCKAVMASATLLLAGCAHDPSAREWQPAYSGPVSDHFNGQTFYNPEGNAGTGGAKKMSVGRALAIGLGKERKKTWPHDVPVTPTVPAARVEGNALRVTWIGHATTLVQTQGLNILLDPVWAHFDSPIQVGGPRRVRQPGVRLEDLPKIDLILLSHNHYDHLDIGAIKYVFDRDKSRVIAGLGNDVLLARHGITAEGLDWGDRTPIASGVSLIVNRAHHWSAHGLHDHDRTLWCGFTLTTGGGNIYYAGDTGPGDMSWLTEARKNGPFRLAILPIGPYRVEGPQTGNHIGPDEAAAAFRDLGARYALGVHWGTFELSDEPIDGPPDRLRSALAAMKIEPGRFQTTEAGQVWDIP